MAWRGDRVAREKAKGCSGEALSAILSMVIGPIYCTAEPRTCRCTHIVGGFLDGNSTLILICAWLRYMAVAE